MYSNITERIELLCDLVTGDLYHGKDNANKLKDNLIMELHRVSNIPEIALCRDKHSAYVKNIIDDDTILDHIEEYRNVLNTSDNVRILNVICRYHEMLADRIANTKEAYVSIKDVLDFIYS